MSFKNFSSAHNAPGKGGPAGKPKEAAAAAQPATQPQPKPAAVAPAPKS